MPRKKSNITESIAQRARKNFELCVKPEHYDRTLRDYRDRLKSKYSKAYDLSASNIKDKYPPEIYKQLCIDTVYRKRRISAYLDVIKDFAEKYEASFPELCIEDDLGIFFSVLASKTPDITDEEENVTLALALFILDSIYKSGNFTEAVYFIPRGEFEEIELPVDFCDASFENDVIKGVMYLIKNRFGSANTYFSPETAAISKDNTFFCEYRKYAVKMSDEEYRFSEISNSLPEDVAVKYFTMAEKMTMQERYFALISFIRPEIIERAVSTFRSKTDEMVKIILEITASYRRKTIELAEEGIGLTYDLEKANELLKNQNRKMTTKIHRYKSTKSTLNVLSNPITDDFCNFDEDDMEFALEARSNLDKIDVIRKKISVVLKEMENQDMMLNSSYDNLSFKLSENARESEPEEAADFRISNPYEILFGYLYLLDSGDSLPWIPHIFSNVCGYAVQQLPWNSRYNSTYWDLIDDEDDESDEDEYSAERTYNLTVDDDSDEYAELFEMKYTDAFMWVREDLKIQKNELIAINLPQIIYSDSNFCMPRYREYMYEDVQAFVKSGFSRKQAELMRYFKSFAECSTNKLGFQNVINTEALVMKHSGSWKNQSPEELRKALSAKDKEVESLKKKLYEAQKQAADLNKKIDKMRDDSAAENQELLELRDLIYKIQNSSVEEAEQETSVSFPYRTKQRVVVFGGHATWLKVIVKLLPNVKFIDPYADPDVNTIRNADVVWLQTNAMPHNKYNKIMEIVRMKKIPVKYFACASAEKCAVQVVEYDSAAVE